MLTITITMPEGPIIVILKELVQSFTGKTVLTASGQSQEVDMTSLHHKKITAFKSWGKHFLICFSDTTIRIHFMMFGSYLINKRKSVKPELSLQFESGELNFYTCQIKTLKENPDQIYDWTTDVMSDLWDAKKAKNEMKKHPSMKVCDALLDQQLFSGVGNIIKNEVLFRVRIHPGSLVESLPIQRLNELIKEARIYSFDFLKWKKENELSKHWEAYKRTICPRCHIPLIKEDMGKNKRSCFYCGNCQVLYKPDLPINLSLTFE